MENEMKFIIDKTQPFRGTTKSILKSDGTVAYTDGITFEDYNKAHGGKLKVITEDELDQLIIQYQKNLQKPWVEIDKDYYWDQYECLPPIFRGRNFWFISEATYGVMHQCYVEYKGKYYTALRNVCMKGGELGTDLLDQLNSTKK